MISLASLPRRTLALAATVLLVAAVPGLRPQLILQRDAVLDGELWRLVTGHLLHGSSYHLLWNVVALVALGLLFERSLRGRVWSLLTLSALVVGGGLLILDPGLPYYVGLSGLLNGLFVGGALLSAREESVRGNRGLAAIYRLFVFGDLFKIGVEAWTGTPVFTDSSALGGAPVPLAHALGSLAAFVWLAASRGRRRTKRGHSTLIINSCSDLSESRMQLHVATGIDD